MSEALGRFPVCVEIPVAWGEMDAFQHVNNVAFVRWIETARVAYLERLGVMERMQRERVGPIVGHIAIDYRRPLTYPDSVRVEATVRRIGTTSFTMAYRIFSSAQGVEAASAEDVIVMVDYRCSKSIPVDEGLRAAIAALEASASPDAEDSIAPH